MAMTAARRTREIGLRMALGATRGTVVRLFVREQLAAVAAGVLAGVLLSAWAVRFVQVYLYGLNAYDPRIWFLAVLLVAGTATAGTLIPAIAVPLSLIGTFGVMYLLGFSLNNLSLMALTIATGFVVDDAIVMIENVARYVEQGMAPLDAALEDAGGELRAVGELGLGLRAHLPAGRVPGDQRRGHAHREGDEGDALGPEVAGDGLHAGKREASG